MKDILRTQRLLLRPLVPEDAETLVTLINDHEVSKWLTQVPYPYTRADADWFIASDMNARGTNWAIEADGKLIGSVGLTNELGYWLARRHWRKGYMSEAAHAVMQSYFAEPGNMEATSGYFLGNAGSKAILEGLGFAPTQIDEVQPKSGPVPVKLQRMRLSRADWQARHG